MIILILLIFIIVLIIRNIVIVPQTESLSTSETLNTPHQTIGNSTASSKCPEAKCTAERTHQKAIFEPDI